MDQLEQQKQARAFVERWQAAEGSEDREGRSFWTELYQDVLGVASPTKVLDFEKQVSRGGEHRKADVFHEDVGVLVEMKSRGVDLDKPEQRGKDRYGNPRMVTPFEQAKWYADNITPRSIAPRWLVTCNFDELRIYDLDDPDCEASYETLLLAELPQQAHRLSFLMRKENSRLEREKELSIKAGEVVGRLYDAFSGAYANIEEDAEEQRSLNILITRLVFLVFAEDAKLLQEHQAFYKYLEPFPVNRLRTALQDLFRVLNTPEDERDPYDDPALLEFPYVNGGLFADDILIPQLTDEIKKLLLQDASAEFDWSKVSPTIFGAVFESTLNPETRRAGGMHYTSIENIHKVTGPLFYDALKDELTQIESEKQIGKRKKKLEMFRRKIASIKVLDPACGSGNFLTETYLSLRKLENRAMEQIFGDQIFMGDADVIQVSISQFYGIEANDFAVSVAKTALWIAELQMMEQTREIMDMWIEPLPLKTNEQIVCGNALRMDWNEVLPADECCYIIGNPPFYGASMCSTEQKQEIVDLFTEGGKAKIKLANSLDYVSGWYYKACLMMQENPKVHGAFVSTNSITQGEQVYPIWNTLMGRFDVSIDFAWRTFIWDSEASDKAHVHCVIIGFSCGKGSPSAARTLFTSNGDAAEAARISPYLIDADPVVPASRKYPLCDVPPLSYGNKPTDDGNLILSDAQKEELLAEQPDAAPFIREYIGAKEFLNGKTRWCLWLLGQDEPTWRACPAVAERVERVRAFRASSSAKDTQKRADFPWEFFRTPVHDTPYMAVPRTSSENRRYLPIGFFGADTIPSDAASVIPGATLYQFGVLESQVHNAWMRTVCGRLESRYRYSGDVVYNNFIWPDPTPEQLREVECCAQAVLDARGNHPGRTLAQMYDGISPMPESPSKADLRKYDQREYDDLKSAHAALDAAVEAAYGVDFGGDEERIVAHLFKLYAEASEQNARKPQA